MFLKLPGFVGKTRLWSSWLHSAVGCGVLIQTEALSERRWGLAEGYGLSFEGRVIGGYNTRKAPGKVGGMKW